MDCIELFSRKQSDPLYDLWGNEVPQDFKEATTKEEVKAACLAYEDTQGIAKELAEVPY